MFFCAAREISIAVFNQKVNEFPIGNAQSEACQSNAISSGSGSRSGWVGEWVNGSQQSQSLLHTKRDRKRERGRERKRQRSLLAKGNQCGEMAKEK